jgi:EAL domain-containing protein (putative c-di-GMP-specific phosphodiesterase class I)
MNRVVDRVVEIDGGELISYSGNYDYYAKERLLREAQREAAYSRQQAMLQKEQRFIERFATHAAKAAQVQSRVKKLEKIDTIELPRRRKLVNFDFRTPPRSGDDVAMLSSVVKRYGDRAIYDGFDLTIRRGERWCVMGRNGAGKTTLLKMVSGALAPDAGTVRLGASLQMGYFAQQSLDLLDPDKTLFEQMQHDFPLETQGTLRALLGAFQFSGDDVDKPVRALSGGEKSRLVIARMLLNPPNFLVLDEPTNHLDLETKEMLVAALANFEGRSQFFTWVYRIAVNLSVKQLSDPDLVSGVARILAETGVPPETLKLELTESSLMTAIESARDVLAALQALHVGLKLDDFGTGYSSLSHLRTLHFDSLKIDPSFVQRVATDRETRAIVETIVKLAHTLDMNVVAEGIETEAQLTGLIDAGCDTGQGFLFSRPLPAEAAEKLLEARRAA